MKNRFMRSNPEYVTVGFVARCCGVSNTTVLRWIERGQLAAFRLPAGHYRIVREAFAEFLVNHDMPLPDRDIRMKTVPKLPIERKSMGEVGEG